MSRLFAVYITLALMPIRPPEFDSAAEVLAPHLAGLPPKIVAVDGRAGSGKTTFSRFLSWYFNSSLIELDLYLKEGGLVHRTDDVKRLVEHRLSLGRPVIVEGLMVLSVLRDIGRTADYLVYVINAKHPMGLGFGKELDAYDQEFHPLSDAAHVLRVQQDG